MNENDKEQGVKQAQRMLRVRKDRNICQILQAKKEWEKRSKEGLRSNTYLCQSYSIIAN
jgi:hypothetical protein